MLSDKNRVEFAHAVAHPTARASPGVDYVDFLLTTADGLRGAVTQADHTARAILGDDRVGDEAFADFSGTGILDDVRLVFVAEVADGGKHRVGGGLP